MRLLPSLAAVVITALPLYTASAAPAARAARPRLFTTPPARDYSRLLLEQRQRGSYQAKIIVPVLRSTAPPARAANAAVLRWARGEMTSFVRRARKEGAGSGEMVPEYYLDGGPGTTFVTPRMASVTLFVSDYYGGAHGMHSGIAWNFGTVNGRTRELKLADLFTGTAYRTHVNNLVMKKLKANPRADWVHGKQPDVTALTTLQLNSFSVLPDGLNYHFDPYEMGSYASGPIDVKLSVAELGPTFRSSWLR